MKIIKAYLVLLSRLRNNEHYDFFQNIDGFVVKRIKDISEIAALWTPFHTYYIREDDIYKRSAKAIETKYINEIHQRRGAVFMFVRRSIEAALYNFDDKKKEAAVKLTEVNDNYKSAANAAMTEVSALLHNMIEDFRKPRYEAAITTLGLTDAVEKLEELNEEFKNVYAERTQNIEASGEQGTMAEIRPIVDKSFKLFTDAVNSFYAAGNMSGRPDADNPYSSIITFINGYIEQYERIYSRRSPGFSTGKKDDKPDVPGIPDIPVTPIPTLAVASQVVGGVGGNGSNNYGSYMILNIEDTETLARVLYPAAKDGILRLTADDISDPPDFPIFDFELDGAGHPVGIDVYPSDEDYSFNKPLYSMGECKAEIYKGDSLLAILTGVVYPGMSGGF
ncbi:MAG: DUF6261 family protein [Tannerellaceae bacterium]|jgi:hypothetical protein|nr:DUF6261 family protein [Tannerellaceae bacterium]